MVCFSPYQPISFCRVAGEDVSARASLGKMRVRRKMRREGGEDEAQPRREVQVQTKTMAGGITKGQSSNSSMMGRKMIATNKDTMATCE